MTTKDTDWRPGPTVCRCCLTEGCYKDISTEYFWMGKREVYSEMLAETLNLAIAYSQSGGPNSNSRLICEACISRLRDASDFKRQVVECEKTFMQHLDSGSVLETEIPVEQLDPEVKLETVKLEKRLSDDDDDFDVRVDFLDDDDDDLDDQPLTKLASKIPKKESVDLMDLLDNSKAAEKRKSSTKAKPPPPKKLKVKKEVPKPTASTAPKPEKKKKDIQPHTMAKRNAELVLQYTTVYPFRIQTKSLKCVYCWEEYLEPEDFRRHMDENHPTFTISTAFAHLKGKEYLKVDITNLNCRVCSEPLGNLTEAAEHIAEFHDKKIKLAYDVGMQPYVFIDGKWACYICDKKLPSLRKLSRHTTTHYQRYTCDVCGKSYLTNEALKYHIRCSHSGVHSCRKCWKQFSSMEEKKEHLRLSTRCKPFCCIYCSERFLSWDQKTKHLEAVHNLPKPTYSCSDCDKVFNVRKEFYKHYKFTHTDESFVCSFCKLKFSTRLVLEDHKVTHTGEKNFKCPTCFKCFSRSKSLTQHMWIHSENKRFVCLICDKKFAQKVSLKGHLKNHHQDIRLEF